MIYELLILSRLWLSGHLTSDIFSCKNPHIIELIVYELIFCFTISQATWKFDGDSKSNIDVYLKWLSEPQKFVIMMRCKINFDIIWYSVIFAANLYLSIFVWSSDILNFVFMNVVILVFIYLSTLFRQQRKMFKRCSKMVFTVENLLYMWIILYEHHSFYPSITHSLSIPLTLSFFHSLFLPFFCSLFKPNLSIN